MLRIKHSIYTLLVYTQTDYLKYSDPNACITITINGFVIQINKHTGILTDIGTDGEIPKERQMNKVWIILYK
jgi:hypothetical protein